MKTYRTFEKDNKAFADFEKAIYEVLNGFELKDVNRFSHFSIKERWLDAIDQEFHYNKTSGKYIHDASLDSEYEFSKHETKSGNPLVVRW